MTQYKYYSQSDTKKESIGKVKALDLERAIKKAAAKKRLSIESFLELFNIEEA